MEERKILEFLSINNGYGYCDGDGDGSGYGSGSGSGYGDGYGDGSGLKTIGNRNIYKVDGVNTVFVAIKNNIAKAEIVHSDLTMEKCYIGKVGNHFAHASTPKQAMEEAMNKHFCSLDIEERIEEFKRNFKKDKKYKGEMYFDWHNKLTGSCEMGRKEFVSRKNINLSSEFTVKEFLNLVKDEFGWEEIKELESDYV